MFRVRSKNKVKTAGCCVSNEQIQHKVQQYSQRPVTYKYIVFLLVNLSRYFSAEEWQRANLGCLQNTNQKVFNVNFEKIENIRFFK